MSKRVSEESFNPTEKLIDSVKTLQELVFDTMIESVYDSLGSLEFVILEKDQKDSISYLLNTDSLKLIYNIPKQEIVVRRIFPNEELFLRKNLKAYKKKGYHVVLTWNHQYYTLYVNADTAETRIKIKYSYPKKGSNIKDASS